MIQDSIGNMVEFEDRVIIINGRYFDKASICPKKPFRGSGASRSVVAFYRYDVEAGGDVQGLYFDSREEADFVYKKILRALSFYNPYAHSKYTFNY